MLSWRSATSNTNAIFIIIFGLLAALAIAVWGVKIGRSIPASPTRIPVPGVAAQPVPAFAGSNVMAPLYANEFSPILAPQFSPGTEQLLQSVPSFTRLPISEGALFKRYVDTDTQPQHSVLQPAIAHLEGQQQVEVTRNNSVSLTEALADAYSPIAMPQKVPELVKVGVGRGGLLRRYTLEKPDQE